ncbi:MAG TPA: hypothetical protein VEN47_14835, partial [Myxococcota bacterium]|nr:hypothetical protein [Myxococcota bacterium]
MADPVRPALAALAERLGVFSSYYDIAGTHRPTSDATREALCAAMGFACASEVEAGLRLEELVAREAALRIAPVQVFRGRAGETPRIRLRAPASERRREIGVELVHEAGERARFAIELPAGGDAEAREVALPTSPGPGVHELALDLGGTGAGDRARQLLIVAPATAWRADEALGSGRALGLWTNLYTLRSRANWGFGDFSDLARLCEWSGPLGVEFVAVNPL